MIDFAHEFREFLSDPVEVFSAGLTDGGAGAGQTEGEPVLLYKGLAYLEWNEPGRQMIVIDAVMQSAYDAVLLLSGKALEPSQLAGELWVLYLGQRLELIAAPIYNPRNKVWALFLVRQKRR